MLVDPDSPARADRARACSASIATLPEIAALIDSRQFEIITAPRSGVVVIPGGAGSGKTTIGLHRIAYLAYAYPRRFPPRISCGSS